MKLTKLFEESNSVEDLWDSVTMNGVVSVHLFAEQVQKLSGGKWTIPKNKNTPFTVHDKTLDAGVLYILPENVPPQGGIIVMEEVYAVLKRFMRAGEKIEKVLIVVSNHSTQMIRGFNEGDFIRTVVLWESGYNAPFSGTLYFDQEFQNNLLVNGQQILDFKTDQTTPPKKVDFSKMVTGGSNNSVTIYAGGSAPKINFANQPFIKSVVIETPPKTKLEYSNINPKTRIVCKFSWTKNPREMTIQKVSSILVNLPRFSNMLVCKNLSTRLIGGKMEEFLIYCKIIIGWYNAIGGGLSASVYQFDSLSLNIS